MPILNYTTSIEVTKTAGEIQARLVRAKAQSIMTEFDATGTAAALAFRIGTPHGLLSFRLDAKIDGVFAALKRNAPPRYRNREQAARVAWRVLRDWIEAQLARVEADQAEVAEVFLPYIQEPGGRTLYEALHAQRFEGLALPAPAKGGVK